MKIIVSLFHTTTTETLYLLDESLEVLAKIKSDGSTNAKGVVTYTDKVIVAQKDDHNECYLLVYSQENFILLNKIAIKETKDVHSICISGNEVAVVSTGTNEIHFYDLHALLEKDKVFPKEKRSTQLTSNITSDTIHLNGIALHEGHMFISGFGAIKENSRWSEAKNGFILNLDKSEITNKEPLSHPHSLFVSNNDLYYCESGRGKIYRNNQVIISTCDGYHRGLATSPDARQIYVGVSSRFYKETSASSTKPEIFKYELNPENEYQASKSISLGEAGSEIYDIVLLN